MHICVANHAKDIHVSDEYLVLASYDQVLGVMANGLISKASPVDLCV